MSPSGINIQSYRLQNEERKDNGSISRLIEGTQKDYYKNYKQNIDNNIRSRNQAYNSKHNSFDEHDKMNSQITKYVR